MLKKFGVLGLTLASALAVIAPQAASAQERGSYDRGRQVQAAPRIEQRVDYRDRDRERRERERREYQRHHRGYYDRYGRWHSYR